MATASRKVQLRPTKWFTRAAEQDYTEAQHNLGAMYGTQARA